MLWPWRSRVPTPSPTPFSRRAQRPTLRRPHGGGFATISASGPHPLQGVTRAHAARRRCRMLEIRFVGLVRTSVLALAVLTSLLGANAARATSFALDAEFDNGTIGNFGTVDVTEQTGGGLLFPITLNTPP